MDHALHLRSASRGAHRHGLYLRRKAPRHFAGQRGCAMKRNILLSAAAAAAFVLGVPQSAISQTAAPDLNGFWTHGFSLGFEAPPEGGPGPVQDFKTRAQMR